MEHQLSFDFMREKVSLDSIIQETARRDDIVMLLSAGYDEWNRLNRIEELACIYKLSERAIKDYEILYRYLGKKNETL